MYHFRPTLEAAPGGRRFLVRGGRSTNAQPQGQCRWQYRKARARRLGKDLEWAMATSTGVGRRPPRQPGWGVWVHVTWRLASGLKYTRTESMEMYTAGAGNFSCLACELSLLHRSP